MANNPIAIASPPPTTAHRHRPRAPAATASAMRVAISPPTTTPSAPSHAPTPPILTRIRTLAPIAAPMAIHTGDAATVIAAARAHAERPIHRRATASASPNRPPTAAPAPTSSAAIAPHSAARSPAVA
ncbi:MAG: hypothetical protein EXR72_25895 [Myxococcales bacterium]|nr:hypothetical protein [Myxococcales bacterium]